MAAETFKKVAPSLWVAVEEIVMELLASANPITEPQNGATEATPS